MDKSLKDSDLHALIETACGNSSCLGQITPAMKEVVSTLQPQPSSTVKLPDSQRSLWCRVVSWLHLRFEIPYGYEDERGFHYGVEPAPGTPGEQTPAAPKVFTDRASDVIPSPCPVPMADAETIDEEHRQPIKG